ncbi:hypothetical protein [Blautia obeum]|uniref:Tape measure domain n=1 Tax=Blautia obeum A2-162 TaxID=657314 RepID=D4LSY0_9FIRM|nr:hypothetical protein [Blautia obeum]CBL23888.1 hypothetical protein CK5_25870 [Blautia obeum A2-162]
MADGSIIIDTRIDTGGVSKGMNAVKAGMTRISAQVSKMGDSAKSSFQRQITAITDLYQNYEKQERKVSELKSKLEELSKVRIETEEYKKLKDDMKALENEFEKVETKQREWLEMGFSIDSAPLKELDKQMDGIWADIDRLQRKQKEMQASGRAYVNPASTDEYKGTAEKYNAESQKLERMNGRLYSSYNNLKNKVEEYRQKNSRLVQVMQNLQKAAARVGMVVKNMGSALRSAGSSIKSMVSAMKKAVENMFNLNKQTNRSRMSLSRMLGMSLLFSGVFRAVSAVSDGVKTGFENLAQYSNSTNSAISSLMSSMTRLKNSFATAFAPVLTVVAPSMSRFIDMISRAITYVGMFVAALTGQNSFVKAVGVQEDYAASLDKTSKNAKKASKQTKSYLSSLDEVHKASTSGSAGTDDSGGYKAPTPGQMFETVPIANSIKGIADKIKKLIKSEDWEGLGAYIASGINKGLKKVYDAINWKKVGPKITKFCNAFTRTFNSLVNHIDWDLMGRTVGAGINTIVNTLNLLITGINWKNLGKKFATGIAGFVREVNWNNLGQLIGNRFMIAWNIFNGMVHSLPYKEIGQAVADGLNGICSRISFREIADTLATGLNGAFTTLYSFTRRFDWTGLVNNIAGGINTFISEFDWKNNGRKLEAFLNSLCSSLVDMAEKTDWEAFGQGIGEMLGQINWVKHLKQAITAITRTLGGLFEGLEASGTAGKIAAFLGKAFIAVKIADITGIGSLVKFLVTTIGKKLITEESVQALAGNISNLTNGALAGSTSGIATFASSLGSLVGTAGAITLVTAGTVMLTKKIAELVETAQGGNGILTQTGGYLHDYAGKMGEAHAITNKQVEELWALVEADETAGKSNSEMYDSMVQKLGEYGVSAEKATQILEQYGAQAGVSSAFVEEMTGKVQALGKGFSESSSTIDTSSITVKESIKGIRSVLYDLSVSSSEYAGTYRGVLEVFNNTSGSAANAQDAFNIVYNALKEAGVPLDELNKKLAQEFPSAAQATKSSVDSSIVEAQKTVSSSTGKMKTDAETNLAGVKKAAEDASGGVNTTTVTNWGNSASEVKKNLDKMKQTANLKLGEMQKTVDSHFSGQYNTMTNKWKWAGERIAQIISEIIRNTERSLEGLAREMKSIGTRMGNNLANGISNATSGITRTLNNVVGKVNSTIGNINSSLSGIERAFSFSYDVTGPTGNRRWGYYNMSLPRVNTIPYLAKGAVIPPRSEFLAVLGDQKQGNNIEAPEALLRKIVREETGGQQSSGNYRFTAQINRRTVFDEIIEEAKLRQNTSGRNPFELA